MHALKETGVHNSIFRNSGSFSHRLTCHLQDYLKGQVNKTCNHHLWHWTVITTINSHAQLSTLTGSIFTRFKGICYATVTRGHFPSASVRQILQKGPKWALDFWIDFVGMHFLCKFAPVLHWFLKMFVFQLLINYLIPHCPLLFLGLKSAKMFMEIDHMFAKLELLSFIKSFLKIIYSSGRIM